MEEVARRLEQIKAAGAWPRTPVGLNLGKNKDTPLEKAGEDYLACFRRTRGLADYFVVNVSSPNTPGLRELQHGQMLDSILGPLRDEDPYAHAPLLIKIAPDLNDPQIERPWSLPSKNSASPASSPPTPPSRSTASAGRKKGGASGRPLTSRSTEVIRVLHRLTGGTVPIIGVGGIFTATDAREKLAAGASLLQLYTGFVYEGPLVARRICEGLLSPLPDLYALYALKK